MKFLTSFKINCIPETYITLFTNVTLKNSIERNKINSDIFPKNNLPFSLTWHPLLYALFFTLLGFSRGGEGALWPLGKEPHTQAGSHSLSCTPSACSLFCFTFFNSSFVLGRLKEFRGVVLRAGHWHCLMSKYIEYSKDWLVRQLCQ